MLGKKPTVPPKPKYLNLKQPVARKNFNVVDAKTISDPFQSSTNSSPQLLYESKSSHSYCEKNDSSCQTRSKKPDNFVPVFQRKTSVQNDCVGIAVCDALDELEHSKQNHKQLHEPSSNEKIQDMCLSAAQSLEISPRISNMHAHLPKILTSPRCSVFVELPATNGIDSDLDERSNPRDSASDKSSACESSSNPITRDSSPVIHSKSYKVAQEIVTTEYDYLQSLKLLLVDLPIFVQGSVPPEDLNALFVGLSGLFRLSEDLYYDLKKQVERYPDSQEIAPVFLRKGHFLGLYVSFVADFEKLIDTYRELQRKYPNFAEKISQFEISPACKKIPLVEYLHKPIQRLPRIVLLLGTYLRALSDYHPDRENAKKALDLVSDVCTKANTTLASVEKVSRLLWYQARTIGYTFLRSNRTFIRDGTLLKLSRKVPQNRIFILCSDALICGEFDALTNTKFTVNVEYLLSEIMVRAADPMNFYPDIEFELRSTTKSCVFQATSIEDRNSWIQSIQRAIEDLPKKSLASNQATETTLTFAPVWIPDYRARDCSVCRKPFNIIRRYHHCRKCGAAVCSSCSPYEVSIDYKRNRPKRVCSKCYHDTPDQVKQASS